MKKIIAILCIISSLLITSSCTKDNSVTPAKAKTTIVADKNDVGVGD